eukprot:COSAG01_NODE_16027_length_1277_cov_1.797963_2_plen_151_part_00
MFVYAEPVDNNYLNETAPEGGPDTPQFYDCRDSTTGIVAAATATALCTLLLPLYRLMDPKFGLKSCHTDSWEERLAADEAKLKHEWELGPKTLDWSATLLRAKITAVWRVAESVEVCAVHAHFNPMHLCSSLLLLLLLLSSPLLSSPLLL